MYFFLLHHVYWNNTRERWNGKEVWDDESLRHGRSRITYTLYSIQHYTVHNTTKFDANAAVVVDVVILRVFFFVRFRRETEQCTTKFSEYKFVISVLIL